MKDLDNTASHGNAGIPEPLKNLFFKHVVKRDGGCWAWTSSKTNGYGAIFHKLKKYRAHRVSWMIHNPTIPIGSYLVCHKCDNPECTNPDHLFLGTHKDNTADMIAKGRHKLRNAKICPQRHEYSHENTYVRLGRRYCRACDRARKAARYLRQKSQTNSARGDA